MNRQQFRQELKYGAELHIAQALLRQRLITEDELYKIRTMLIKKYRPVIRSCLKTKFAVK